jgi:hypothetical protein
MIKWEYCYTEEYYPSDGRGTFMERLEPTNTISFRYLSDQYMPMGYRFDNTAQIIEMLGADGWEMCGVVDVAIAKGDMRKLRHYFKRQLPEK